MFVEAVEDGYVYYTEANAGGTDGVVKRKKISEFEKLNGAKLNGYIVYRPE